MKDHEFNHITEEWSLRKLQHGRRNCEKYYTLLVLRRRYRGPAVTVDLFKVST
jgi:hypothetical protein